MKRFYAGLLPPAVLWLCFLLNSCEKPNPKTVHRSFYYWRSLFKLSAAESTGLQKLNIENLYVKFFDVTWNDATQQPEPVAQINFSQSPPPAIYITPVLFITNETLQKIPAAQTGNLARNLVKLLSAVISRDKLNLSREIQIDCDWTATTKDKYFQLLDSFKHNIYCKNKIISATIRLHQLKFTSENGIPPVDKGLLMCYNMGNLRHPETVNSIIEPAELKKYIQQLPLYPLPLDVALPVFDWWVWFRGDHYKGLVHAEDLKSVPAQKKILFQNDSLLNGYTFEKGDWLRYENSPSGSVQEVARLLDPKLTGKEINVILYSLDENNLSKYKTHELESFFDGLH